MYKFINNKLFKYNKEQKSYTFVYSSIYATSKTKAIKLYKLYSEKNYD